MSDAISAISDNTALLPIVSVELLPVDLLNRQTLVDQIIRLLDILSDARGSCTFALNGKWGSGKTFVLNMLEQQLREYQDGEKYIVFHYNCWQYDYYDEPLVAIIASMLDSLDEQAHIFPSGTHEAFRSKMTAAKPILKNIAASFAKNKLGVDIKEVLSLLDEIADASEEAKEKTSDEHEYDQYYAFKKAMQAAKEGLQKLASAQTVVVVVDELDRCLPNYAIKVLERIHHLFYGLENTAVLMAVDKSQLDTTIKQIFGESTDASTYLKKFINFEIALDVGKIEGSFSERYTDYVALFDKALFETDFSLDNYFAALFAGIEIRTQERLMDRIKTIHLMLFSKEKKDYSFMCFELLWIVLSEYYGLNKNMPIVFDGNGFQVSGHNCPEFTQYMRAEWSSIRLARVHTFGFEGKIDAYEFPPPIDIPQLLIWYLSQMHPDSFARYQLPSDCPRLSEFKEYVKDFKNIDALLQVIK